VAHLTLQYRKDSTLVRFAQDFGVSRKTITGRLHDRFDQGIPLPARRTLPSPFIDDAAALRAGVISFCLSHNFSKKT
jgi:hypothetical protein